MARPRKPTKILELSGAFKKDPQRMASRANEPVLPAGSVEAQEWIDMDAREQWSEVVPALSGAGVTSPIHAGALSLMCQAYAHAKKAQAEIFRDGITIMTESGLKKHPALNVFNDAMKLYYSAFQQFGGTPSSQSKVSASKPKEEANEFAAV